MGESDAELTGQILAGSDTAARELVRRYERPVYNLIVRMVRDPALAEDLAQETFVKAFRHLASYDPGYKFANWILRIAHNTAIDYLRQPRPALSSLDEQVEQGGVRVADSTSPTPFAEAERKELAGALEQAIDRLRPEYREVVVLRYQEDLSYEEIAEMTDLPVGTVKSHLHRARAELAEMMAAAGWAPNCNTQPTSTVGQRERS